MLNPNIYIISEEELGIEVSVDDYLDKLVDYALMKIYAIATVKETQQTWAEEDDFQVDKPTLKIEVIMFINTHRDKYVKTAASP